jgi:hypothetical protein
MKTASQEWRKDYYIKRKQKLIDIMGGECISCHSKENLEFDHTDKNTKEFDITGRYDAALARLLPDLEKCQLLCHSCHIAKSQLMGDMPKLAVHGTYAMYRHHKCRCSACRTANNLHNYKYKKRKT